MGIINPADLELGDRYALTRICGPASYTARGSVGDMHIFDESTFCLARPFVSGVYPVNIRRDMFYVSKSEGGMRRITLDNMKLSLVVRAKDRNDHKVLAEGMELIEGDRATPKRSSSEASGTNSGGTRIGVSMGDCLANLHTASAFVDRDNVYVAACVDIPDPGTPQIREIHPGQMTQEELDAGYEADIKAHQYAETVFRYDRNTGTLMAYPLQPLLWEMAGFDESPMRHVDFTVRPDEKGGLLVAYKNQILRLDMSNGHNEVVLPAPEGWTIEMAETHGDDIYMLKVPDRLLTYPDGKEERLSGSNPILIFGEGIEVTSDEPEIVRCTLRNGKPDVSTVGMFKGPYANVAARPNHDELWFFTDKYHDRGQIGVFDIREGRFTDTLKVGHIEDMGFDASGEVLAILDLVACGVKEYRVSKR